MTKKAYRSQNPDRTLGDGDYAALASFRKALRIFMAFSEEEAREAGLTAQQHQAILAIRGLAPEHRTIHELAEQLLLKPQTAVELVDRLELAGFVRRERDDEDRRRVFLSLTAKANAILDRLSTAHLRQIRRDAPELIELLIQMSKPGRKR